MTTVAVVIPTLNAERWLPDLLEMLRRQKPQPPEEIILVDSGSTDRTTTMAATSPGVRCIPLDAAFTHGGSRNTGIRAARAEVVVLMTQDAIPADETWLRTLIAPLEDPAVAGVFSRQVPRPDAPPMERFFLADRFPDGPRIERRPLDGRVPVYPETFFSNVSSAARRETWLRFPFDESLLMSEDQQFARDVLIAGLKTVYEPSSVVVHSHTYTLKQTFQRYFDSVVAFRQVTPQHSTGSSARLGWGTMRRELAFIMRRYPVWLPYYALYQLMRGCGALMAQASDRMRSSWCAKCSLHPAWWLSRGTSRP